MKHVILLFLLAGTISWMSCKNDGPAPADTISGEYNVNVHYYHSWFVSQQQHGLIIDTSYSNSFKIQQINSDTISIVYGGFDGNPVSFRMGKFSGTSVDSISYCTPYYGYDGGYSGARLTFSTSTQKLYFYAPQKTNPSGGGLNKYYEIKSL